MHFSWVKKIINIQHCITSVLKLDTFWPTYAKKTKKKFMKMIQEKSG